SLEKIRIVDPACGSGAFLIGMMQEIIRLKKILSLFFKTNNFSDYRLKLKFIQNNLYGVDIDSGAVEIAKLRLWLSLVVDEQDINNIKPLPNLDYKIVCGNSLLGYPYTPQGLGNIELLKNKLFSITNPNKKQKLRDEIDGEINKLLSNTKKSLGYKVDFDFKIHFSEVFREKDGFDIIIANPPYVKEYVNKSVFDGLRNFPYYQGKMDLWYMFACRSIDLVRDNVGVVTFIAQNNWVTSYGASKMRNKVIQDTQILGLIDFGNFKVFETAGIQTMVMIFRKNSNKNEYNFDYRRIISSKPVLNDVIDLLNKAKNVSNEYLNPSISRRKFLGKKLLFSNSEIEVVLNKIYKVGNFHLDAVKEVAQGIVCPQDFVNKTSQKKLNSKYKVGTGIFVLKDNELKPLNLSKKELTLIKPFYTTKELRKWSSVSSNKKWVIYTDSSFRDKDKTREYPKIKNHLDKFKKVITSDNKPYGLHRSRDKYFFKSEKIIVARKCLLPTFTYTNFDSYVSATFYVIKTKRLNQKYLTGLLNSKLITFWLKHKGKMQGSNYQIDKEPILELPLIKPNDNNQKRIVDIVDKILAIIEEDDYLSNSTRQAKVCEYEKQIDKMVYKLYGLIKGEIKIIEDV
ncbi:MAG: N-6 DNA methylase, partial [Mariniphaga sp.]|nr:N-6 DNA methylase [Mariniphaga sp.]